MSGHISVYNQNFYCKKEQQEIWNRTYDSIWWYCTYFYLSSLLLLLLFSIEWKSYLTQKKKNPRNNKKKNSFIIVMTYSAILSRVHCWLVVVVVYIAPLSLGLYCNSISGGVVVHNISSYGINECYLWRLETRAREFVVYGYCRRKTYK